MNEELIQKLEALIEGSKILNQQTNGTEVCKNCALQEQLEELVKAFK